MQLLDSRIARGTALAPKGSLAALVYAEIVSGRAAGLTDIAKRGGLSVGHLSNLMRGAIKSPSDDTVDSLASALSVSAAEIRRRLGASHVASDKR